MSSVEREIAFKQRKEARAAVQESYLQSHPEIRQMLHDFVASCLTLKPDNVQDHARAFFAQYQSDLGGSANAPALQPVEPVAEPSATVSESEAPAAVESSAVESSASSAAPLFRPLVVCGPSGVGKGTILNMLLQRHGDHFAPIPSHTSRAPRDGEVDGVNYHFSNLEDMQRDIDAGLFVEYATVHGNLYGKSRRAVQAVQATGKVSVIELDVQGAQTIKQSDMNAYFVFIEPPSIDHLEERLRGRGTETDEQVATRLEGAQRELSFLASNPGFFDFVVTNHELDGAFAQLSAQLATWYPHTLPSNA